MSAVGAPPATFDFDQFATLSLDSQTKPAAPKDAIVDTCMEKCGVPREVALIVRDYVVANKTRLLFWDVNSIRYQVPDGKPDPRQPCTAETERVDCRFYVRQKGARVPDSSQYFAFNMIRFRIGKNASSELVAQRAAEAACSRFRKERADYYDTLSSAFPLFTDPASMFVICDLTKEVATRFVRDSDATKAPVLPLVRKFIAPTQTRYTSQHAFWNWYSFKKSVEDDISFIRSQNYTPQTAFALIGVVPPYANWKQFTTNVNTGSDNARSLRQIVSVVMAKLYQLTPSTWQARDPRSPHMDAQPVDLLIAELRAKGPLVIQGEFGRTGYSQNPENLGESTAEQEVLGWKPGTRQPTEVRQAITVVGAVKEPKGAEYVYYVDPFDASDPVSGTRRPLYKISYRSLQENATPFCPGVFAYGARLSPNVQVTSPFTQPPTATTTTATTAAVPVMPRVFVKIKRATRSPN